MMNQYFGRAFFRHGHHPEHGPHEHPHHEHHGHHERFRHGRPGMPHDFMRGFEAQFFGGFGRGRGRRARRGDVKYLVLELLAEGPKHGYEIIRAIEERRGVRPSAGSVYPTLQMLEDGGFVTAEQLDGKRVYTITPEGRTLLAERAADPDDDDAEDEELDAHSVLKHAAIKLAMAVATARGSDDATLGKIRAVLDRARKEVYAILASDET
jgi:DNA-binding PadR family transcriptional regulator